MRPRAQTMLAAALLLAAGAPAVAGAQPYPTRPPAPMPLAPAQFPPFREEVLPNGVRLLVVESRRQPVIAVSLSFAAGAVTEPLGKTGMANMVAGLLGKGAGARNAEQFAAAIEGVGGGFGAAAGDDFLQLSVNTLSRNAALAFELLADATMRPTFPEREVELLRTQTLSGLELEKSQPAAIAARTFRQALYGAHPYGRSATEATVKAITRADLVAFHKARLRPQGALLVVAGDLSLAQARTLATKAFAGWAGAPAPTPAPPPVPPRARGEVILVHRPGSVQSNVLIGNVTWGPADPRRYAATVANEALGGGSEGRFFRILREQKGWTYGSYSEVTTRRGPGAFTASGEFRTEVTDSAVTVMLQQIRALRDSVLPAQELADRQGSLTGRFPLLVETAEQVANRVATARLLGLPADYVQTYRQKLAAVTAPEARLAAAATFRPDQGVIVVVGDGQKLWDALKGLAPSARLLDVAGKPLAPEALNPKPSVVAIPWERLVARTDSFTVLLQGNPFGYQVSRLARGADGWTLTERSVLGPIVNQTTVVTFGTDGAMRALKQDGTAQGQAITVDVRYAGGRATGTAKTPGPQGLTEVKVNAEVPAGILDDNLVPSLLPLFPLAPGATVPVTVFNGGRGNTKTWTVRVEREEIVTVPAGTFATYRVAVDGPDQPVTFFVNKGDPRRIVKIAFNGVPLEIVLAK
ncbi:MAG: insulinase family protein [Gemmatimonadetes bacterium]|nr:insulinase family protein [Gemmatimonadota bacterium]